MTDYLQRTTARLIAREVMYRLACQRAAARKTCTHCSVTAADVHTEREETDGEPMCQQCYVAAIDHGYETDNGEEL